MMPDAGHEVGKETGAVIRGQVFCLAAEGDGLGEAVPQGVYKVGKETGAGGGAQ